MITARWLTHAALAAAAPRLVVAIACAAEADSRKGASACAAAQFAELAVLLLLDLDHGGSVAQPAALDATLHAPWVSELLSSTPPRADSAAEGQSLATRETLVCALAIACDRVAPMVLGPPVRSEPRAPRPMSAEPIIFGHRDQPRRHVRSRAARRASVCTRRAAWPPVGIRLVRRLGNSRCTGKTSHDGHRCSARRRPHARARDPTRANSLRMRWRHSSRRASSRRAFLAFTDQATSSTIAGRAIRRAPRRLARLARSLPRARRADRRSSLCSLAFAR